MDINSVERFLGDEALRKGWQVPVDAAPTGKRVLVVGAGPSGLSAAYHLARLGHSVTGKDAGATLELNTTVTDIQAELNAGYGGPQHRRLPARHRLRGGG